MDMSVVDAGDDTTHVTLVGRLDPHASHQVRERLRAETVGRDRPAVLDISGVTFITSVGIGLLVDCAERLRKAGHRIVFVKPSGHVDEVLEKTGVYAIVTATTTTEEAFALLGGE
jgi:anti-anti-sigma factor